MTEWGVVVVIIALVGLIAAVVGPIVKLNTTITRLTVVIGKMEGDFDKLTTKNTESHGRLWDKNEEQDKKLEDHEKRINILEVKR